jgi:F0F1-type ATP synthase epsilon subunit
LPGHVPFLSALKPGVFVYRNKQEAHILAVSDGVLEVVRLPGEGGGDKVLVLVSDAAHAPEIDRDAAAKEVATADAELARWNKDVGGEYKALLNRRAWAAARVDAAGRATPH